jgi:predicted Zn-dependent protease with MMP-like domain
METTLIPGDPMLTPSPRLTVTDGDPFDEALDAAIADLPEPYRRQLASVAIVVEEWPNAEQLRGVGAFGLFGLYQGVPRTAYGADGAPVASKITLFRGPLMRAYPTREALIRGVRETFDHEVAHHLGISDARMRELKATSSG